MSPFILGYKTHGLNLIKVFRDGNNFIYPKHIPFFGYNLNPDMNIYKDYIKCSEKLEFFNFKILLQTDKNFVKEIFLFLDNLNFLAA